MDQRNNVSNLDHQAMGNMNDERLNGPNNNNNYSILGSMNESPNLGASASNASPQRVSPDRLVKVDEQNNANMSSLNFLERMAKQQGAL